MAYEEARAFYFTASNFPEETFAVTSFKGREAISSLYEFEINLVTDDPNIDLGDALKSSLTLKISYGEKERVFHGIPAFFELVKEEDTEEGKWIFYKTLLVPRLWYSDRQLESQLFLDKKVPDIIEEILKQAGLVAKQDYEFHLTRNYRTWEYICQYKETDYNFISRWMEREGIYFFFEQKDGREKLIITDSSSIHKDISSDSTIYYSPPSGLYPTAEEVIKEFMCRQERLPQKVILKDYNYRKPSLEIKGEATVDPDSRGIVYIYGEHFKTPEEGNELAKIRAEELKCREKLFLGEGTAPSMASGFLFKLEDHYRDSFNQKYLITEVEHEGRQTGYIISGLHEDFSEDEEELIYRNRFIAIPANVQFRPERKTEKPRFYGTINAKIDASGDGKYAEIDEWGRYKVVLPFDLSGRSGGKASRWVRMAQPYAGAGFGMHFPLHKGTEVLLTFVDGDPDRPIIAASVPNPETMSPVTSDNQTQCVIRSAGGNQIHMEDQDGNQLIKMHSPTADSYIRIGAPNPNGDTGIQQHTSQNLSTIVGGWETRVVGTERPLSPRGKQSIFVEGDRYLDVHGKEEMFIEGERNLRVNRDSNINIQGKEDIYIDKDRRLHIHGKNNVTVDGDTNLEWKKKWKCVKFEASEKITVGATSEQFVGAKSSTFGGIQHETNLAFKISVGKTKDLLTTPQVLRAVQKVKKKFGKEEKEVLDSDESGVNKSVSFSNRIEISGKTIVISAGNLLALLGAKKVNIL